MSSKTRNELWPKKAQKNSSPHKNRRPDLATILPSNRAQPATGLMPSTCPKTHAPIRFRAHLRLLPSAEDLTITGDVTSKGELRIDGRVQGNVHCLSLILGENSEIKGDVKAEDVLIGGRLIGSVRGRRVILQSTAHVEGDLLHKDLAMEQGAYFQGESRRSRRSARCCPTRAKTKSDCGRAATGA